MYIKANLNVLGERDTFQRDLYGEHCFDDMKHPSINQPFHVAFPVPEPRGPPSSSSATVAGKRQQHQWRQSVFCRAVTS